MAEFVHLFLKSGGSDIQGDATQKSHGREGSIECLTYDFAMFRPYEQGTGVATSQRRFEPITIRKRFDKSSPLLLTALSENQSLEAEFRFYRPMMNDNVTENFYTVAIKGARLVRIKQISPTATDAHAYPLPVEEVSFVYHTIKYTYTDGGIEHEDSWSEQA